jgi:hypothetical protein
MSSLDEGIVFRPLFLHHSIIPFASQDKGMSCIGPAGGFMAEHSIIPFIPHPHPGEMSCHQHSIIPFCFPELWNNPNPRYEPDVRRLYRLSLLAQNQTAYSQPAPQASSEEFMPFIPFGENANGIL